MGLKKLLLGMILGASALTAQADDWGCKVLLCLANPNGPKAVTECVPPIDRLYHALSKNPPDPFPTCDTGGGSWAQRGYAWYDICPSGTTALQNGEYAVQTGYSTTRNKYAGLGGMTGDPVYTGIGEGDSYSYGYIDGSNSLGQKICVGGKRGDTWLAIPDTSGEAGMYSTVSAGVYDTIAILDPQTSPRVIDVYVNNNIWRRVRW